MKTISRIVAQWHSQIVSLSRVVAQSHDQAVPQLQSHIETVQLSHTHIVTEPQIVA